MILREGPPPVRASARVAKMMIMSSIPYIYHQRCLSIDRYLLTTNVICQETEPELADDIATRSGDFEGGIIRGRQCSAGRVDVSEHDIGKVDREKIVSVGVAKVSFSPYGR